MIDSSPDFPAVFRALQWWRRDVPDSAVEHIAARYGNSPWAILAATVLSLRTKDEVTVKTASALLDRAPAPRAYLALTENEAEKLAYPAGFYRTKARQLRAVATIVLDRYGGNVPATMDDLLALPGVGRKTANLVLSVAFGQDAICVDTHVHRITNRLGWVATKTPEATEMALREILPRRFWQVINSLLVLYGQRICCPLSPFCSRCAVKNFCEQHGVGKAR
ncbi:endonuclease III [Planctomycetales bacterium]|nr:endonuclease III [Planctomycetales bacterium]GHT08824.1 endonuclease III [Planctomycetales bacterium]